MITIKKTTLRLMAFVAILLATSMTTQAITWQEVFNASCGQTKQMVCPLQRYGAWQDGKIVSTIEPSKATNNEGELIMISQNSNGRYSIKWVSPSGKWEVPCTMNGIYLVFTHGGETREFRLINATKTKDGYAVLCVDKFSVWRLYHCVSLENLFGL